MVIRNSDGEKYHSKQSKVLWSKLLYSIFVAHLSYYRGLHCQEICGIFQTHMLGSSKVIRKITQLIESILMGNLYSIEVQPLTFQWKLHRNSTNVLVVIPTVLGELYYVLTIFPYISTVHVFVKRIMINNCTLHMDST